MHESWTITKQLHIHPWRHSVDMTHIFTTRSSDFILSTVCSVQRILRLCIPVLAIITTGGILKLPIWLVRMRKRRTELGNIKPNLFQQTDQHENVRFSGEEWILLCHLSSKRRKKRNENRGRDTTFFKSHSYQSVLAMISDDSLPLNVLWTYCLSRGLLPSLSLTSAAHENIRQ